VLKGETTMTKRQREKLVEAGRKIWEGGHGNRRLFSEGMGELAGMIDSKWQEKGLREVLGLSVAPPPNRKRKTWVAKKAKTKLNREDPGKVGSEGEGNES
jgi:hypothetical protein